MATDNAVKDTVTETWACLFFKEARARNFAVKGEVRARHQAEKDGIWTEQTGEVGCWTKREDRFSNRVRLRRKEFVCSRQIRVLSNTEKR